MSKRGAIQNTIPDSCELCGNVDELRPYGRNGEYICFDCGTLRRVLYNLGGTKMHRFKYYRKKNLQMMRPYELGEDLTGISVNKEDTPELGGMVAMNSENPEDKWYVAKKFFEDNYELVGGVNK